MSITVGNRTVRLHRVERGYVYEREDRRVFLVDARSVEVLPHPAVGYGVRFLMLRLKEGLVVPPGDSLTGYLSAPVDVSVRVCGSEIDRFTICREKYALYGKDNAGVITRYWVTGFSRDEPESLGAMKVVIRNPAEDWGHLDRIVVPIANSPMFYSPERAYYPLVIVTLREFPEVNNTGNPPDGTLKRVGKDRIIPNFLMRW
ncbi:MAG: DUF432 domain-containing protein [Thermococci archaeon]|nr:DUF432 domain-containing protein [Thermococci archaeon]